MKTATRTWTHTQFHNLYRHHSAKFHEWVHEISKIPGRFAKHSADYVSFLAFTGLRTSEAAGIEWKHCNFGKGEILVEGPAENGTKNGSFRRVPMIPETKKLLERLAGELEKPEPNRRVMNVREAQKSMDHAAAKVGMERITHHDLRHFFATICIESGVDVPTVSRWLGHKDGGALAMKVYGHLRNEHSIAAAARVDFSATVK